MSATDEGAAEAGRAREEAGHVGLPDGHDRDAARFEVLERCRHVEDRLRPGAHDGHRGPSELLEVGRDVEGGRRARWPSSAPRWTPPIPPVARTRIPAAWAAIIVAETVVAAHPPSAMAAARLGRAALRTDPGGAVASDSMAASSSPTSTRPAWIATVAGIAPGRTHGVLRSPRDGQVLGVREPVADQRRFEGDDRTALGERGRDLGADVESVGEHQSSGSSARGVESWRAAAR